jgi:hypothetical protein
MHSEASHWGYSVAMGRGKMTKRLTKLSSASEARYASILGDISGVIDAARRSASRSVNCIMTASGKSSSASNSLNCQTPSGISRALPAESSIEGTRAILEGRRRMPPALTSRTATKRKRNAAPAERKRSRRSLRDLVARIPRNYKPREIDWGKPRGREEW